MGTKTKLAIICILLQCTALWAGISGVVKKDGQVYPFAKIMIIEKDSSQSLLETVAEEDGTFYMDLEDVIPGLHDVVISPQQFDNTCLAVVMIDILLGESEVDIGEVSLASTSEQSISYRTFQVTSDSLPVTGALVVLMEGIVNSAWQLEREYEDQNRLSTRLYNKTQGYTDHEGKVTLPYRKHMHIAVDTESLRLQGVEIVPQLVVRSNYKNDEIHLEMIAGQSTEVTVLDENNIPVANMVGISYAKGSKSYKSSLLRTDSLGKVTTVLPEKYNIRMHDQDGQKQGFMKYNMAGSQPMIFTSDMYTERVRIMSSIGLPLEDAWVGVKSRITNTWSDKSYKTDQDGVVDIRMPKKAVLRIKAAGHANLEFECSAETGEILVMMEPMIQKQFVFSNPVGEMADAKITVLSSEYLHLSRASYTKNELESGVNIEVPAYNDFAFRVDLEGRRILVKVSKEQLHQGPTCNIVLYEVLDLAGVVRDIGGTPITGYKFDVTTIDAKTNKALQTVTTNELGEFETKATAQYHLFVSPSDPLMSPYFLEVHRHNNAEDPQFPGLHQRPILISQSYMVDIYTETWEGVMIPGAEVRNILTMDGAHHGFTNNDGYIQVRARNNRRVWSRLNSEKMAEFSVKKARGKTFKNLETGEVTSHSFIFHSADSESFVQKVKIQNEDGALVEGSARVVATRVYTDGRVRRHKTTQWATLENGQASFHLNPWQAGSNYTLSYGVMYSPKRNEPYPQKLLEIGEISGEDILLTVPYVVYAQGEVVVPQALQITDVEYVKIRSLIDNIHANDLYLSQTRAKVIKDWSENYKGIFNIKVPRYEYTYQKFESKSPLQAIAMFESGEMYYTGAPGETVTYNNGAGGKTVYLNMGSVISGRVLFPSNAAYGYGALVRMELRALDGRLLDYTWTKSDGTYSMKTGTSEPVKVVTYYQEEVDKEVMVTPLVGGVTNVDPIFMTTQQDSYLEAVMDHGESMTGDDRNAFYGNVTFVRLFFVTDQVWEVQKFYLLIALMEIQQLKNAFLDHSELQSDIDTLIEILEGFDSSVDISEIMPELEISSHVSSSYGRNNRILIDDIEDFHQDTSDNEYEAWKNGSEGFYSIKDEINFLEQEARKRIRSSEMEMHVRILVTQTDELMKKFDGSIDGGSQAMLDDDAFFDPVQGQQMYELLTKLKDNIMSIVK